MSLLTSRTASLLVMACVVVGTIAYSSTPAEAAKIIALKSADVDVYNEALEGFKSASQGSTIVEYDMEGDFQKGKKVSGAPEVRRQTGPHPCDRSLGPTGCG